MSSESEALLVLEEVVARVQSVEYPERPEITLAWAQSLDGSIARRRGERTTLSGKESLIATHALRAMHDAVLVGIGTVLADRPHLTVREVPGRSPAVVVLDGNARISGDAPIFESGVPVYLFHRSGVRPASSLPAHAEMITASHDEEGYLGLPQVLRELYDRGVRSLMVEGGGRVLTSFLNTHLVDLAAVTIAPVILGGYGAIPDEKGLRFPVAVQVERYVAFGNDMMVLGTLGLGKW